MATCRIWCGCGIVWKVTSIHIAVNAMLSDDVLCILQQLNAEMGFI